MKFVADRGTLLPALKRAASVAPRANTIPILGHCLIEARKDRVTIAATDLYRAIVVSLEAEVGTPGRATVDVRLLSQFVAGLADGGQVEISLADHLVKVRGGRARASFPALEPGDFPQMTPIGPTASLALEGKAFAAQLGSVGNAQSNEETRYYLNGVYLHRRAARELVAVATNGHVLARTVLAVAEDLPEFPGAIVPRETVAELVALAEEAGTIALEISATMLRAEAGDTVLTSKLIDGTFPDYEKVIPPADIKSGFEVGREALARALKRVGVFATEKGASRPVRFTPEGRGLALLGRSDDQGEISDEIDARTSKAAAVGMNARYVLAALDALGGTDTRVRYADPGAPIVFTDPAEPSRLQIVMALRV